MEQYLDAKVKRYVQRNLFKQINKAKTILGLAGTHPEKYREVLPKSNRTILVDFNPVHLGIRKNSLIGEFDIISNFDSNYNPITFVDCDFCRSIITNGVDLLYIYNKMKLSKARNKYIAFTFSMRGVGEHETIKWLSINFPELNITRHCQFFNDNEFKDLNYRQYVQCMFDCEKGGRLNLYKYRDSGDNMISGLIKL